jgi:hypothetical protein
MSLAERLWWLLTGLCVVWYATITVYVALRGALDIRHMLARLGRERESASREQR